MSKQVKVEGFVHAEPVQLGRGTSFDVDLGWEGLLAHATPYDLSLTGGSFSVTSPLPARAVGLRVRSGGPVVLTWGGPSSGSITVDSRFMLVSEVNPITSLSVQGTAEVDLLVAG